ncbi:MAG TPA: TlpA disulfide reductase family protein [Bryobacteraceae bacterium]|nr:TlpA disulfide reductase family protein [Bryobacteraceae bacterium]
MVRAVRLLFFAASLTGAQDAQQAHAIPSAEEQADLMKAVSEGGNSSVDMLRALEGYLAKYPNSVQRLELYRSLTRAAIDVKDDARIVKYGVPALEGLGTGTDPVNDPILLDRVTRSLLALGGADRAQQALRFARAFEDLIDGMEPATGRDAAKRQDDRERALGRALTYQATARTVLGQTDDAERVAARAFAKYPSEETGRAWSESLLALGRTEDAMARLADAFSIPDQYALPVQRQQDRQHLGELYAKLHGGSQKGLGDMLLEAYDRMTTLVETRLQRLAALDPNSVAKSPLEATISSIDGKKLNLATLKGKVLVMDFWATWCEPCRAQHPLYEQVRQKFGPRNDLVFLTIDADDDRSLVEPFLAEQKWDRNVYYEDGLSRMLGVNSIPTTILFGKNGLISSRMTGFAPSSFADQLTERIAAALAEP